VLPPFKPPLRLPLMIPRTAVGTIIFLRDLGFYCSRANRPFFRSEVRPARRPFFWELFQPEEVSTVSSLSCGKGRREDPNSPPFDPAKRSSWRPPFGESFVELLRIRAVLVSKEGRAVPFKKVFRSTSAVVFRLETPPEVLAGYPPRSVPPFGRLRAGESSFDK